MTQYEKITFCIIPRPLFERSQPGGDWRRIGWVWLARARLVRNISMGWIAFTDQQSDAHLNTCPTCNRPIKEA